MEEEYKPSKLKIAKRSERENTDNLPPTLIL